MDGRLRSRCVDVRPCAQHHVRAGNGSERSYDSPMPWDVEVVADSDSRWKWGATLAERLSPDGSRIHATLLLGRSCPTDRQLADIGIRPASIRRVGSADAVARLKDSTAQVVVLACVGGGVQTLLHALSTAWAGHRQRPVVVSGYVGLVYERVLDGLLARAGSDVVLANSARDAEAFRAIFSDAGVDPSTVVQTALPFLSGAPYDPAAAGRDRPFTLTFVAQPGVPHSKADRRYALEQAVAYARTYADRHVLIKLRGRPGERTTHVEPHHYTSLVDPDTLPSNLAFAYGAMEPVLDRTDLCVTVSSTAAIEAMHRGIPTGILVDFGVREHLGNQLFLGSGAMTSWHQLLAGAVPSASADWLARNGARDPAPYDAARARVAELVASGSALPPLRPWLTQADAARYLPALLASYGIGPDGAPLYPAGAPRLGSRAVRNTARRAYAYGVRVLEPRIKRIAQL